MTNLHETSSVWNRQERDNINQNWTIIAEQLRSLQRQITFLAGGTEVDELLAKIDKALADANISLEEMQTLLIEARTTIDNANAATSSATAATEEAKTATGNANAATAAANEATANATNAATLANEKATAAEAATTAANAATTAANEAAKEADTQAFNAENKAQAAEAATTKATEAADKIAGWGTTTIWSANVGYVKNNTVSDEGQTWQAKRANKGVKPVEGEDWTLIAKKGTDGTGSVSSVNGVGPDESGNVTLDVGKGSVKSIDGILPDDSGNVEYFGVRSVNGEPADIVGDVNITPALIGLGNVNNTSDMEKPVSTAQKAAIDAAKQAANIYTDEQIQGVVADGIPKLVSNEISIVSTTEGQTVFEFTDALFDVTKDTVLAFLEGEPLNKQEYTLNQGEADVHSITITTEGLPIGTTVWLVVFRNVPVGPEGAINAGVLQDGTIAKTKLHADVAKQIDDNTTSVTNAHTAINDLQGDFDVLNDDVITPMQGQLSEIIPRVSDWNNAFNTIDTIAAGRLGEFCKTITNWDDALTNGYYMGENVANSPFDSTNWHMGIVVSHNNNWIVQKVIRFGDTLNNIEFERRKVEGVWSDWVEISPMKLFQSVSNGKAAIANAITQKGVATTANAEFATMAANIGNIPTGAGYATGTFTPGTNRLTFITSNGGGSSTLYSYQFDLNSLNFTPKVIRIRPSSFNIQNSTVTIWTALFLYMLDGSNYANISFGGQMFREIKNNQILSLPLASYTSTYIWEAWG